MSCRLIQTIPKNKEVCFSGKCATFVTPMRLQNVEEIITKDGGRAEICFGFQLYDDYRKITGAGHTGIPLKDRP